MREWIAQHAADIAARAGRELEALVAVSSPSGDGHGAEECASLCTALAPNTADAERIPCSSPDCAPDLLLRQRGEGDARILLLGHVDTVIPHADHRPLERADGRWTGSGAVDMKGGVVLALGVLRALAERPADFAEIALLLVNDEEWRRVPFAHAERFEGWDACLCFEAGERTPDGGDAVIVRRKAAGSVRVGAHGRAAHAGSAPEKGLNALLALADVATHVGTLHDPEGSDRMTAVPTMINAGSGLNVVPAEGELICDLRALSLEPIERAIASIPADSRGVRLETEALRLWPGMDTVEATAGLLEDAGALLGRSVAAGGRGGASDASHMATTVARSIDGLGPRGGHAHHPDEFLLEESLPTRAEVALAVAAAALGPN